MSKIWQRLRIWNRNMTQWQNRWITAYNGELSWIIPFLIVFLLLGLEFVSHLVFLLFSEDLMSCYHFYLFIFSINACFVFMLRSFGPMHDTFMFVNCQNKQVTGQTLQLLGRKCQKISFISVILIIHMYFEC